MEFEIAEVFQSCMHIYEIISDFTSGSPFVPTCVCPSHLSVQTIFSGN